MTGPLLHVEGLGKRFGGFVALEDINLTVGAGERVGLIGPNGSGKSTLVNCLCGTLTNETGTVRFEGRNLAGLAAHQRTHLGLARSFQLPRPFVSLTVLHGFGALSNLGHPPKVADIPAYVFQLYSISHSLVVFGLAFGVVWFARGKPLWEMGAWGLHIVTDIFTHATTFFPTPFLWPLAKVQVNGHPWSDPLIFFPNLIILAILYAVFFWRSRSRASRHAERNTGPGEL